MIMKNLAFLDIYTYIRWLKYKILDKRYEDYIIKESDTEKND